MRLGDVLQLQYGKPLPEEERDSSGRYAVYGANGEKARSNRYLHDNRSIVVGRKGSAGEIKLTEEKFWPLDVTYFTTFDESRYDLNFLYYLLGTLDLPSMARGVKPGINRNDVYALSVNIPALPEQHRIVALLDEAFASIATAKAKAEKCLSSVREVEAGHRKSIFSEGGWFQTTLDRVANNLDSRRVPITKSDRKVGEYPYYGASGIVDYVADYIFDGDALLVSEDGANLLARSTPIAFSVTGKYWVNNHAHILQFEDMATQKFVEFYLESIPLDQYITGAAQPKLNQKALNSIPVPMPSTVSERAKVVSKIEAMKMEAQRLESIYTRKLAALAELKQSLLQRAFSGNL